MNQTSRDICISAFIVALYTISQKEWAWMFMSKLMNDENVPCMSNRLLFKGKNKIIKVIGKVGGLLNYFIKWDNRLRKTTRGGRKNLGTGR